jgi:hypothetical protein
MTATISSTVGGSPGYRKPFVAWRMTGVKAGHRRRRPAATGGIKNG